MSAEAFMEKMGVAHLPEDHVLRREAMVVWARYYRGVQ